MRVPDEIRKSVVFLGCRVHDGSQQVLRLGGTAFFVSVPGSAGVACNHIYLVTARHNILSLSTGDYEVRLNDTNGQWRTVTIPQATQWWYHPTEHTDVAVLPFDPGNSADMVPIPVSMFLTDEIIYDHYIGQGDDIYIAGLFTRLTGQSRNTPIIRRGTVAMMPDDPVPRVNLHDRICEVEAYLIEVRSVGGISGSPVFLRSPIGLPYDIVSRTGKRRIEKAHISGGYHLLGLVHGHWEIPPDKKDAVAFPLARQGEPSINLGIAIAIPAKKILDILNRSELVAMRKEEEQRSSEAEGTTTADHGFQENPITRQDFEAALKKASRKIP
jgi:hypothetical protein